MKPRFKFVLFLFLLCVCSLPSRAGGPQLREELEFLTDSLSAGRGMGTAGAQNVAFYLLRQMRNQGLRTTVQTFTEGGRTGHNVVAVTPGWFKRYIVVGAYFDGLGTLSGEVYPGADSNASGVAALLSLSRSLPELCTGDIGLIFVAFDGHNASMSGSRAFLAKYRFEYPICQMVNLDIIGSSLVPVSKGRPDYLIVLGGVSHQFSLDRANRELKLDLSYDYYGSQAFTDLFYRKISDQKWFLEAGIPSVMFTSGITMNTNKSTDTVSRLDLPLLSKRISLIGRWLASML